MTKPPPGSLPSQAEAPLFKGRELCPRVYLHEVPGLAAPQPQPRACPFPALQTPRPPVQYGQTAGPASPGPGACRLGRHLPRTSRGPSHGDLRFAVGAQVPRAAAHTSVKARRLRAQGFGQLLHAEVAPRSMARPPGRGGRLHRQVAARTGPGTARGPGHVGTRGSRDDRGRVARWCPGAGVQPSGQVLGWPRSPHGKRPRSLLRCGKTLGEVLRGGLCGDSTRGVSKQAAGKSRGRVRLYNPSSD